MSNKTINIIKQEIHKINLINTIYIKKDDIIQKIKFEKDKQNGR